MELQMEKTQKSRPSEAAGRGGATIPIFPPVEMVREAIDAILASASFRRSRRMSRFLSLLADRLTSGAIAPSEKEIASSVFDKLDFDARVDPIVRVEARRLRRLLEAYAKTEGESDSVVIAMSPRGYTLNASYNSKARESANGSSTSRSVAVLPFANLTHDPSRRGFCDGVTEEVFAALTRVDDLKVASRTSASQFRGPRDVRMVGQELGVDAVLEGSVRIENDTVRVTAHLSDATDGFNVWSETFDAGPEQRMSGDTFTVQETIAKRIAKSADRKLSA
jgi:serine/threonine-protein kinase